MYTYIHIHIYTCRYKFMTHQADAQDDVFVFVYICTYMYIYTYIHSEVHSWFTRLMPQMKLFIVRSLLCMIRSLLCIHRSLVYIHRSLLCTLRSLLCILRSLPSIRWNHDLPDSCPRWRGFVRGHFHRSLRCLWFSTPSCWEWLPSYLLGLGLRV